MLQGGCNFFEHKFHFHMLKIIFVAISYEISLLTLFRFSQKKHGGKDGTVKCQECDKEVKGQIIRAVGFAYHPECFKCCECKQDLSASKQFTTDKENCLYCQKCYNE